MDVQVHVVVSGVVQGVGFRFFVLRVARKMGLVGWVKNLPTGDVEILAEGPRGLVNSFVEDVRVGNLGAVVRGMDVTWGKRTGKYTGFEVG